MSESIINGSDDVRALVEAAIDDGHTLGSIFRLVRTEFGCDGPESMLAVATSMRDCSNPKWMRVRDEWFVAHPVTAKRIGL